MPCPEKFREKLIEMNIPEDVIGQINQGFEDLVSSSPKKRKDYCFCCAGHFLHHYQIMLGVKLKTLEIISSALNSDGKDACVIRFLVI